MSPPLNPARRRQLLLAAAAALAVALLLPLAMAGGLGRLVGGLWVTVMGAVAGLLAAMFGG